MQAELDKISKQDELDKKLKDKQDELDRINQQLWKDPININHSGNSYGFVMREMECLAKNGYNVYKNAYSTS